MTVLHRQPRWRTPRGAREPQPRCSLGATPKPHDAPQGTALRWAQESRAGLELGALTHVAGGLVALLRAANGGAGA